MAQYSSKLARTKKKPGRKPADAIDADVGMRIRLRRLDRGISQAKLADAIGVTPQQVQKYEKGANRLGAGCLIRIAEFLQVPAGNFFGPGSDRDDSDESKFERYLALPGALRLMHAYESANSKVRTLIVRLAETISTANGKRNHPIQ